MRALRVAKLASNISKVCLWALSIKPLSTSEIQSRHWPISNSILLLRHICAGGESNKYTTWFGLRAQHRQYGYTQITDTTPETSSDAKPPGHRRVPTSGHCHTRGLESYWLISLLVFLSVILCVIPVINLHLNTPKMFEVVAENGSAYQVPPMKFNLS